MRECFSMSSAPGGNMLFHDISIERIAEIRANEAREETREEERKFFLSLLDQDLSTEEIKQRLTQTATI